MDWRATEAPIRFTFFSKAAALARATAPAMSPDMKVIVGSSSDSGAGG